MGVCKSKAAVKIQPTPKIVAMELNLPTKDAAAK